MPSFYDLLKYAATGIASPGMTAYDKMRAVAMGGGAVKTLTGVPPIPFRANGKPLISWSMLGNGQQTGTPTPDAPIYPEFVGERTENLAPPMDIWLNGYVNTSGQISTQSETRLEKTSTLIQVDDSLTYTYSYGSNSGYFPEGDENLAWRAIACYDADGVFLSRIGGNGRHPIITTSENALPTGTVFIRLTLRTYGNNTNCMLNAGSTALPYEPYGYKIPITCGGQTTPVYLGQVQTVRRVKKLTFTGMEDWQVSAAWKKTNTSVFFYDKYDMENTVNKAEIYVLSDKFSATSRDGLYNGDSNMIAKTGSYAMTIRVSDSIATTVSAFKSWLTLNPVTVWYVLATPTTGIVNEPLAKIGDYADELHSTDAGVSIPTARGANTLTVDTDLQPSSMTITYR